MDLKSSPRGGSLAKHLPCSCKTSSIPLASLVTTVFCLLSLALKQTVKTKPLKYGPLLSITTEVEECHSHHNNSSHESGGGGE